MRTSEKRVSKVVVREFSLSEVPPVWSQVARPYELQFTNREIDNICNLMVEAKGELRPYMLSTPDTGIIMPSAKHCSDAEIPNDWDGSRYRFIMIVDITSAITRDGDRQLIVQGYTDYDGISTRTGEGHANPRMVFYVNSIIEVTLLKFPTNNGGIEVRPVVTNNSHLLVNPHEASIFSRDHDCFGMRPADICTYGTTHAQQEVAEEEGYHSVVTGVKITKRPMMSRRENCSPTEYSANLFMGISDSIRESNFGDSDEKNYSKMKLTRNIRESRAESDPFLVAMQNTTSKALSNQFTFAELMRLDDTIERRMTVSKYGSNASVRDYRNTTKFDGGDNNTVAAALIGQTLASIMGKCGMRHAKLSATNDNIGARCYVHLDFAEGIVRGFRNDEALSALVSNFKDEIIPLITIGGHLGYDISVECDLFGMTYIDMTIDGVEDSFMLPTYCDQLIVPIITDSQEYFNDFSSTSVNAINLIRDQYGSYNTGVDAFDGVDDDAPSSRKNNSLNMIF